MFLGAKSTLRWKGSWGSAEGKATPSNRVQWMLFPGFWYWIFQSVTGRGEGLSPRGLKHPFPLSDLFSELRWTSGFSGAERWGLILPVSEKWIKIRMGFWGGDEGRDFFFSHGPHRSAFWKQVLFSYFFWIFWIFGGVLLLGFSLHGGLKPVFWE